MLFALAPLLDRVFDVPLNNGQLLDAVDRVLDLPTHMLRNFTACISERRVQAGTKVAI